MVDYLSIATWVSDGLIVFAGLIGMRDFSQISTLRLHYKPSYDIIWGELAHLTMHQIQVHCKLGS